MAEPISIGAVLLAASAAVSGARQFAQGLPRTARSTLKLEQQGQAAEAQAQQDSARRVAAAATTTDPAQASTTQGVLAQGGRQGGPTTLGITRPSGSVPQGARGNPGITSQSALNAQVLAGAADQARDAFRSEPEQGGIRRLPPDLTEARRRARVAEAQRGGRQGTALAPSLGSASELVSDRATLLGR
jgi:hypothetical protein